MRGAEHRKGTGGSFSFTLFTRIGCRKKAGLVNTLERGFSYLPEEKDLNVLPLSLEEILTPPVHGFPPSGKIAPLIGAFPREVNEPAAHAR